MIVSLTGTALVALVGLVLYLLAAGKAQEIGRIMLWTGLLATLLHLGGALSVR